MRRIDAPDRTSSDIISRSWSKKTNVFLVLLSLTDERCLRIYPPRERRTFDLINGAPTRLSRDEELRTFSLNEMNGLPTLLSWWSDRVDGIGRGCTKGPVTVLTKPAKDVARNLPVGRKPVGDGSPPRPERSKPQGLRQREDRADEHRQ